MREKESERDTKCMHAKKKKENVKVKNAVPSVRIINVPACA